MDPVGGDQGTASGVELAFLAHWRSLPREGLIPSISAFLDNPHPGFAPWLNILDVVSEDEMNVRLFGTRLVESFGEITGLNFLTFLTPDARSVVSRAHTLMCATPCGWVTMARAISSTGREIMAETISLPLLRRGQIASVVKLTNVIQHLAYREALVSVDRVKSEHWIDLGAGVPPPADPIA